MVLVDSSTTCDVCLRPIGGESALATHGRLAFPRGHKLWRYNDRIYHYTCFFDLSDREQLSVQMVLGSIAYLSTNDSWQVFYRDSHCFAATNPDLEQIQLEIFSNAAHIRFEFSNYLTLFPSISHAAANESVHQALKLIRKSFPSIETIVARCDLVRMRRSRVQRKISERHARRIKRAEIRKYNATIASIILRQNQGVLSCPACGRTDKLQIAPGTLDSKGYALCNACGKSLYPYFQVRNFA